MRTQEYQDEEWADRDAPLESDLVDDDESETLNCPECGEDVYEESNQCPACGLYITPKVRTSHLENAIWTIAAILVVGACLLFAIL